MADLVCKCEVTCRLNQPGIKLNLLFDSGSAYTFLRRDKVDKLKGIFSLSYPRKFYSLGDGKFISKFGAHVYIKLKGIWCPWWAYVVEEKDLDTDGLIGHDFMQVYDIKLDLRKRRLIVDKEALIRAQRIK